MKKSFTRCLLFGALCAALSSVTASAQTEITVGKGDATRSTSPVSMYNWDRVGQSEVIYPASLLSELEGQTVTAVKFYMQPAMSKDFAGAAIQVYAGTTGRSAFAAPYDFTPTDSLIQVYSGTQSFTKGDTVWTLKFDTPLRYNGGNLSLRFDNAKGKYNRVYFRGDQTDNVQSMCKSNSMTTEKFLPLVTFVCGEASGPGAALSATALTFPMAVVGDTAVVRSVRVSNTGTTELSGSVTLQGSDAFSVSPAQITALQPGEATVLDFSFCPAEGGDFSAQATLSLGDAGDFTVDLSGSAYSVPAGTRTVFSATDYNTAVPEGWSPYALELTTAGDFSAATDVYTEFPTTARFESRTLAGSPMILWNHGNPMPYTEQYQRYFYLVAPASQGRMWIRAIASEAAAVKPFVKAYAVVPVSRADEGSFTIGEEITVTWAEPLNNTAWSTATLEVPAGTRVAFLMKYAGLSTAVNSEASAVTDITADTDLADPSAPAEYYNLQGIRVTDPVPGQLLIRRQGRTTAKVLIR